MDIYTQTILSLPPFSLQENFYMWFNPYVSVCLVNIMVMFVTICFHFLWTVYSFLLFIYFSVGFFGFSLLICRCFYIFWIWTFYLFIDIANTFSESVTSILTFSFIAHRFYVFMWLNLYFFLLWFRIFESSKPWCHKDIFVYFLLLKV